MDWKQLSSEAKTPTARQFFPKIIHRKRIRTGDHDRRVEKEDLSPDQVKAFDATMDLIRSDVPVVSLGGYAGTGKTTLISLLSQALGDTSTTAFCALTGKAANVMARKLAISGVHAAYVGTIHGLMYQPETDEHGRIVHWQRQDAPLYVDTTRITRIILDEASMVGSRILDDLQSYGVPILAVGDPGQLPPINDTSPLQNPDFTLEQIHRQAAGNPIIQLAAHIRKGGDLYKWPESEHIRFVRESQVFPLIGESQERLGLNMGILVRRNQTRKDLNLAPRTNLEPEVGDFVICLRNCPPVFNGMRGVIEKIEPLYEHWYYGTVYFPDDGFAVQGIFNKHQFGTEQTIQSPFDLQQRKVRYPPINDLGMLFDFGTAMTVHKSQGSAFEEVFLKPEKWNNDQDYTKWLYTAVTRAEKFLTVIR